MVYCESCGAANTADAAQCFACQKPITEEIISDHDILLSSGSNLLQGRYRVMRQVGIGGFGAVYRAIDTQDDQRVVAIKQINLKGLKPLEIIEATETFNREVEILSDLTHPNLPRFYEHFTDPEHWYIVMDFIEGQTLEAYLLTTKGQLQVDETLDIAMQVCSVLEYLHTHVPPIIFRDLKPANIMLTPYKQVYLIDFGTARFFKPGKAKDTIAFGSPGYASPEQYGKAQTTPRADIYSLGATLHHLLTGKDPADAPFHFLSLQVCDPALPSDLNTLVMSMVEMEESKRPKSAEAVKLEIQRISIEHGRRLYPLSNVIPLYQPNRKPGAPPPLSWQSTGYDAGQGQQTQGQGQAQMHASAAASSSPAGKGVSRRAVIAGLIALGVLGSRVFDKLGNPDASYPDTGPSRMGPQPYYGNRPHELWNASYVYRSTDSMTAVMWAHNASDAQGPYIAYASLDGTVQVKVAYTNTTISAHAGYTGGINGFSWSNDDSSIASVGGGGTLQIWRASDGKTLSTTTLTVKTANSVAWSPDGQYIAVTDEKQVQIVNVNDPSQVSITYRGHTDTVTSVAWSFNSDYIASASNDGTVQVWSPLSLVNDQDKNVFTYKGHTGQVHAVAWSPDAARIVSAGDDGARVWNSAAGDLDFAYTHHNGAVEAVAWSPDGNFIASGGTDKSVQVWSAAQGDSQTTFRGHTDTINALSWYQDSRTIASAANDNTVQIWQTEIQDEDRHP